MQISSFQPVNPEENYRRLPQNARAIGRKIAIVAHGSPTPPEAEYQPMPAVSHATYKLNFTLAEEGMTCHLITWYIGQRGRDKPDESAASVADSVAVIADNTPIILSLNCYRYVVSSPG